MSYSSDSDSLMYPVMMIGFGVFGFFSGFNKLRKKRLIENIPTSRIRGMAMGTVEVVGQAEVCQSLLTAPLTATPCVYYRYKIEEERGSGKNRHWATIASGDSAASPFYVNDGTGRVLVSGHKAEMDIPRRLRTRSWRDSPVICGFLDRAGIKTQAFLGFSRTLRFSEWHICPGEQIYVLGHAEKNKDFLAQQRRDLAQRLETLKGDAAYMQRVDTNGDGRVSDEEWAAAVRRVEQELIEQQMAAAGDGDHFDIIIGYNPNARVFLISNKDQKELVRSMGWQILLFVWGGAALAVLGLFLLLMFLNLF